ncbi:hypothetical protein AYI68_g7742 [Smittium mucronatum]|uniref:Uncharacterized protein n=1 Tax=Smittium mucronatum TaxID=133383 RepID=A0A1R0GMU9_9FUNG|nr:hypothetical protein AYI68_g7742 [Smittium mucronatum]
MVLEPFDEQFQVDCNKDVEELKKLFSKSSSQNSNFSFPGPFINSKISDNPPCSNSSFERIIEKSKILDFSISIDDKKQRSYINIENSNPWSKAIGLQGQKLEEKSGLDVVELINSPIMWDNIE